MQYPYHKKKRNRDLEVRLSFTGYLQGGETFSAGFNRLTGEPNKMTEVFIGEKGESMVGMKFSGPEALVQPLFLDIDEGALVRVTYTPILSDAVRTGQRITQYQNNEIHSVEILDHPEMEQDNSYKAPNDDEIDPIDNRPRPQVY